MADFVIVIATAAMLAAPAPAPIASSTAPAAHGLAAAAVPLNAPTVGFRTYADAASCEQATAALVAPAGTRLVCVPVESHVGEMASAY